MSESVVTPENGAPLSKSVNPLPVFICQRYCKVYPVASTKKEVFSPTHMESPVGSVTIFGSWLTKIYTDAEVSAGEQVPETMQR